MSRQPVPGARNAEPSRPRGWRDWQKGRLGKRETGLIGLSAAAIMSVYAVGYANTSATGNDFATLLPADSPAASSGVTQAATGQAAVVATPTAAAQRSTAGAQPAAPTPTAAPASASAGTQAATYRDGTYVGAGNSRHGGIQATVVVSGGKITSAAITSCGTRYPCSKIASLPSQTIAQQGVPTNHVSGSTDSSNAYKQAVANALSQAKAQQS
ncbi:MAG: hypothetical protein HY875_15610 [Chloroflexi bacterium]|nr:hypothetical protein [Chloroflexota bacterium]